MELKEGVWRSRDGMKREKFSTSWMMIGSTRAEGRELDLIQLMMGEGEV